MPVGGSLVILMEASRILHLKNKERKNVIRYKIW
jgi:hypothetical protein